MGTLNLDKMFNPKSVAIIGASDEKGSVGFAIVKNFTDSGYKGKIYFINIRKPEILGIKTYPSIEQVPENVDLAIIATPAKTVPDVVEQCGKAKVKGVIIVSAGFKEVGLEGKALEDKVLVAAKKYGTRVVGPNCIGIIRPGNNLNATFVDKMPKAGEVAFLSQSGALGAAILDWAINQNIGFSAFVSVGSMIDVDFGDLIDYLGTDPKTKSILMYVEGITEARKFMSAARHFASTKPVIIVKSGKFSESAKAAASHTGSLSGEDDVYDAAFKRAGIVRVDEIEDLFNAAEVLGTQPLPKGPRLAIITNAGGPGVMTTDALIAKKGELAKLSKTTIDKLNSILPPFWSKGNPIDVLGDAKADRYKAAVEACLDDDNVDGIAIILTQQANTEPIETAKAIVDVTRSKANKNKTILTSFMGFGPALEANKILNDNDIPTYSTPEQAIKTYMYMYQHKRNLDLIYETPEELPVNFALPKRPIMTIFRNAAAEDRNLLTEEEAKKVLKYYNLPTVKTVVATNVEEAVGYAKELGYPVVMKILSPQITHKSDAGGVILNLQSDTQVHEAYETIIKRAKAYNSDAQIIGVTVQPMISKSGVELILGAKKDPLFGPVILFGMGGIGVELFKDYSIGFPPLNTTLIRRMMEETKVYQLLKGYRGSKPCDLKVLDQIMLRFCQLIIDFPQIKEVDINPLLMEEKKATILDARIVIDKECVYKKFEPHEHMIVSPYPKTYETLWTLENGEQVLLRPIKPEDEPLWLEMFQGFSEETIRNSSYEMFKDTPHEIRVRYCNIDYDREIHIIVEKGQNGQKKMLGASRISIAPDGKSGEMAFIVGDQWQGFGLGTKIVDYVLEIAKDKGIEKVFFVTHKDNNKALALAKKMGFKLENQSGNTVKGMLMLNEEEIMNAQCIKPQTVESTPIALLSPEPKQALPTQASKQPQEYPVKRLETEKSLA